MDYMDKMIKFMVSYLVDNRDKPGFVYREVKGTSLGDVVIGTQNPNKDSEFALIKCQEHRETVWIWSNSGKSRRWIARLTERPDKKTAEFEFLLPGLETNLIVDL